MKNIAENPSLQDLSMVKSAIAALQEMQIQLDASESSKKEPIAIVGMGCRFPGGGNNPDAFWDLLKAGGDAIRDVPSDRWNADEYYDPDPATPGKAYTRQGGFLDQMNLFDPEFFGITPREATSMDPQQRLLLEIAWETLENAKLASDRLRESQTGVFVGIASNDYMNLQSKQNNLTQINPYSGTGSISCVAAGRISYVLGLHGPSLALDTACSSSLVAVHLACQSLRNQECNLALAGGINLILVPDNTIYFSKMRALAPDGRCKTFDAAADGFVRSEGCGMVVLKRLSDAQADNDTILAIIRGSSINHDGYSNGLTVPNGLAQQAVIRAALERSGVKPAEVDYVETHGTGTSLGDPIEVEALRAVLSEGRTPDHPLILGALKTNIGHLEGAAGVASLIKVVLSMQHKQIPANLHFKIINPHISLEQIPAVIPTALMPWPAYEHKRIAGISAFGFSGTNAHLIVEEAPAAPEVEPSQREWQLLNLSAKSDAALKELAGRYAQALPNVDLKDASYTSQLGRTHFSQRLAVVAHDPAQAVERLQAFAQGAEPVGVHAGVTSQTPPKVAFLFTGQGSQFPGMGRQLYDTAPVFRQTLEHCNEILAGQLLSVLYPPEGQDALIHQTAWTQPALFALEYALAQLWCSWGIQPTSLLGHSLGEYVAACLAGVFSLEDGLLLATERGRLMQALPSQGGMAAVFADAAVVEAAIAPYPDQLSIAAYNTPTEIVISGEMKALEEVLGKLEKSNIRVRRLSVSHAFHSPLMEPMLAEFGQYAAPLHYVPPQLDLISNVRGTLQKTGWNADYWVNHVRQPVHFAAGIQALHAQGCNVFLEIGPQPTLLALGKRCLPDENISWLPSLRTGQEDWEQMLLSLGELYTLGVTIDWQAVQQGNGARRISLPTYPFQRQRFWPEESTPTPNNAVPTSSTSHERHPLLGHRLLTPLKETVFTAQLSATSPSILNQHRLHGVPILPGVAYLDIALSAAAETFGNERDILEYTLEDVSFSRAMVLPEQGFRTVQAVINSKESGTASFQICSLSVDSEEEQHSWTVHVSGKLKSKQDAASVMPTKGQSLSEARARCQDEISVQDFYRNMGQRYGNEGGPSFDSAPSFLWLQQLWLGDGEALALIKPPEPPKTAAGIPEIHPAMLVVDSSISVLIGTLLGNSEQADKADMYMPLGIQQLRFDCYAGKSLWCHALLRSGSNPKTGETLTGEIRWFDENGQLVGEIIGMQVKRVEPESILRLELPNLNEWFYEVQWQSETSQSSSPAGLPADFLVAPLEIASRLQPYLPRLKTAHKLAIYGEAIPQVERLSRAYARQALQQLGWMDPHSLPARSSAAQFGVIPQYHRLFACLLDMLQEPDAAIPPDLQALLEQFPQCQTELTLLGRCGPHLAKVLCGQTDPLQLLFPNGSMTDLEKLYQDTAFSRAFNILMQEALATALESLPEGRPVRILEIGAGTGGTTSYLLSRLPAGSQYIFTDVSELFLVRAREKFHAYPNFQYQILDIEHDPAQQGFALHTFDVIVAANVLHATADLRRVLRNVQSLLVPGGLLLLLENARPQHWVDLVFGLTEGWWKFQDTDLRPHHPLLAPARWESLLRECGFSESASIGDGNDPVLSYQTVMVARMPLAAPDPTAQGKWLLLADRSGLAQAVQNQLEMLGGECTLVFQGEMYRSFAANQFELDPEKPADFQHLLADLTWTECRGVVDLWALDTQPIDSTTPERLEQDLRASCGSLVYLIQALAGTHWNRMPRLWLATRGAQSVGTSSFALAVQQAPLWGLGKVVATEFPEAWGGLIDLDPESSDTDSAFSLCDEITKPRTEDHVVFRRSKRFIARLGRAQRNHVIDKSVSLYPDATYLIIGGLGGLGLKTAKWMVSRGACHLALVGRTTPSPEAQHVLDELEHNGVQVVTFQADVAQREEIHRVLETIGKELPPLRGIVHSAGVVDDSSLLQQSWERFRRVLASKVFGSWNIHTLTYDLPLDFFVLYSSTASLFGPPGQGSHASANGFLDALAHSRRSQQKPALSINWSAWSEVGAANRLDVDKRLASRGIHPITPTSGVQVLEQLMSQDTIQAAVMPVQWNQFIQQFASSKIPPLLANFAGKSPSQKEAGTQKGKGAEELRHKLERLSPAERRNLLVELVRGRVMKVMQLNPSQPFDDRRVLSEMGLDSLMAIDLKNELQEGLGCSLPGTLAFEYPTVEALVDYLAKDVLSLETPVKETPSDESRQTMPITNKEAILDKLDQLSEEDVTAMLLEKLEKRKSK